MTDVDRMAKLGLGGLGGLALGAGLVGGAWLITGDDDASVSSRTAGARAVPGADLSAPETLGGFLHQDKAVLDLGKGADGRETAERNRAWDSESGERLSEAYGGAAAVVQSFSDSSLESFFQLTAVRGASPRPYVPYEDAKVLGLERPTNGLVRFGKVDCVVHNLPTNAGGEPAPDSVSTVSCQRGDADLTVLIRNSTGDVSHEPSRVARLVDEAWGQLT
ncbi:hypothetical protein PV729_20895 [Streptomyces europaeiscabiei]|uniref:Secreted protein n=1 Tax=Streptomyces europaeiscabiei TaxID=146819 RepID=A0ABU4N9W5_9ACTN|nr:hypothetical protein [Streptomyces europaeiscabiei]MDX3545207.1 hypothetical protein [Streptomyces europaeiscabiei]MDX3554198.1 hypothetical protein [Streptomyces europaeiscabiei]MDX3699551.1 hypothetical protein [Streptomyces europaeiscabiei]